MFMYRMYKDDEYSYMYSMTQNGFKYVLYSFLSILICNVQSKNPFHSLYQVQLEDLFCNAPISSFLLFSQWPSSLFLF